VREPRPSFDITRATPWRGEFEGRDKDFFTTRCGAS
jgi:hypothetical protein